MSSENKKSNKKRPPQKDDPRKIANESQAFWILLGIIGILVIWLISYFLYR